MTLALVGRGDATARESPAAETPAPPTHDVTIVIPEAEDGRPDAYHVFASDAAQPYDRDLIEDAWAPADEESPVEGIWFDGSEGGQFTVIPAPTEPGTYRICGDQPDAALCSAAFEVTARLGVRRTNCETCRPRSNSASLASASDVSTRSRMGAPRRSYACGRGYSSRGVEVARCEW